MSEDNSSETSSPIDTVFQIFKDSNIVIIAWFLAVYFVVYLLLNIFRGKDAARSSISKWIDVFSLLCVLIVLGVSFFGETDENKKELLSDMYSSFKSYINNYLSIFSSALFILTLYIVIYIIGLPMVPGEKPITVTIIENTAWLVFLIVLFSNFLRYILGFSVTSFMDEVGDYLSEKAKKSEITINLVVPVRGNTSVGNASAGNTSAGNLVVPIERNEVFNVGKNIFTYDDAKAVCASFGSRLATYDEVENAYNKGGEWCNYGWSDGQAIYFPTQKETWQKLQKSESTRNTCGRPGVNGGYMDNSKLRFGANCFGKKPKPSTSNLAAMVSPTVAPKTEEDLLLEKKIDFWNANRDKLIKINSYNNNKWSMY